MTDNIIEHIKQVYIEHVAKYRRYPDYKGDYINDFIDYQLLTIYLDASEFSERFKHIQRLAQELIENDSIDDFNEFIEIITNTKRFIKALVSHYAEHIYQYVANHYCDDTFVYEDQYARYAIKDTKKLVEVMRLIAEYEEE